MIFGYSGKTKIEQSRIELMFMLAQQVDKYATGYGTSPLPKFYLRSRESPRDFIRRVSFHPTPVFIAQTSNHKEPLLLHNTADEKIFPKPLQLKDKLVLFQPFYSNSFFNDFYEYRTAYSSFEKCPTVGDFFVQMVLNREDVLDILPEQSGLLWIDTDNQITLITLKKPVFGVYISDNLYFSTEKSVLLPLAEEDSIFQFENDTKYQIKNGNIKKETLKIKHKTIKKMGAVILPDKIYPKHVDMDGSTWMAGRTVKQEFPSLVKFAIAYYPSGSTHKVGVETVYRNKSYASIWKIFNINDPIDAKELKTAHSGIYNLLKNKKLI